MFLRSCLPTLSRGTIQRLIADGDIRINGLTVRPTHRPKAGETIEIRWPEVKPSTAQPEDIPLPVLFEDADLLVLNKPAGMVVHPGAGHEEHTLVNALLHHCHGTLSGIGGVARPGIVHRLDKDTSGCLVVAKNDHTHLALATQFASRAVRKLYHAVVCGEMEQDAGEIRAGIARHPSHRKRMAVTNGGGRDAWTTYRVLQKLSAATFLEAELHTGRTHQIRVHLQHLGHPLVGDTIYGKRQNAVLQAATGYTAPRQLLHSSQLAFVHPTTKARMSFEASLPPDFCQAMEALQGNSAHCSARPNLR
ncbi:MAG: RluA family pseudouridine synthase [Verrucomicrobiota bacterium]